MDDKKITELALLRYGLILPVIQNTFTEQSATKYFQNVASRPVLFPDGENKHVAVGTLQSWVSLYRKHGFDGLKRRPRKDNGDYRCLTNEQQEIILNMKRANRRKTATSIYMELIEDGSLLEHKCSVATVQRFLASHRQALQTDTREDMKAFEMEFANDLWQIDTSHGPFITVDGKRMKTYIIAIIDDASRLLVGVDVFLADNAVNVQHVLKEAVETYGIPKRLYADNGTPYRNSQLESICAYLTIGLRHAAPYHGNQKGKIERAFRTMKEGWMHNLDYSTLTSVEQVRTSLQKFCTNKNNILHSSLNTTPWLRFLQDQERIRKIEPELISRAFLHTTTRRVNKDATIKLDTKLYETTMEFIDRHVVIRYQHDYSEVYLVDDETQTWHALREVNKVENSQVKRRQPTLSGGIEHE